MNFQLEIVHLTEVYSVLKRQADSTKGKWTDSVQKRFYEQYLDSLDKEFQNHLSELQKLDATFNKAEQMINVLKNV